MANLELEHEIGQVTEETYNEAFSLLQNSLKRATTEKTDYELIKSKVSSILIGDPAVQMPKANKVYAETVISHQKPLSTSTTEVINTPADDLPEPPVVVYVKEIGKTGL
jgi:hypothetical protein